MAGRTYLVQTNLDEWNALIASVYSDADRVAVLLGLGLGFNAGQCPTDAPTAFRRAWAISIAWRQKTEEFRISRAAGGKASADSRKAKSGTAQPSKPSEKGTIPEHVFDGCSGDVREQFELTSNQYPLSSLLRSNPTPSRSPSPRQGDESLNSCPGQEVKSPEKVAKPKQKAKPGQPPSASLEDLLGEKGTAGNKAYWALVATFGDGKNPRPKTTAKQYLAAIEAGATAERIQTVAQAYRNSVSDPKFMIQLSAWLEGEAYKAPDLPKAQSATPSKSPSHRAAVDAAYLEQLQARMANAVPQPEPSDEELEKLYGRSS